MDVGQIIAVPTNDWFWEPYPNWWWICMASGCMLSSRCWSWCRSRTSPLVNSLVPEKIIGKSWENLHQASVFTTKYRRFMQFLPSSKPLCPGNSYGHGVSISPRFQCVKPFPWLVENDIKISYIYIYIHTYRDILSTIYTYTYIHYTYIHIYIYRYIHMPYAFPRHWLSARPCSAPPAACSLPRGDGPPPSARQRLFFRLPGGHCGGNPQQIPSGYVKIAIENGHL